MNYTCIDYQTEGRIATITLNRQERMNTITMAMPQELADAVKRANRDDDIHALVLTGAGKGFCGGYDLVEFAEEVGFKQAVAERDSGGLIAGGVSKPLQPYNSRDNKKD